MKKLYLSLSLILAGCGVIPLAPTPQTPAFTFQSPAITKKDVAEREGLDLTVSIFALNNNVAFLFGGVAAYDGEYQWLQSTLLRSEDNGAHWKEVMTPISNSSIREFVILESGVGWALIFKPLAHNQPYQYTMYKTVDYGLNWEEEAVIPLSSTDFPLVLQMIFVDELHGQIDMLYSGSFGYLEFLTTNDGGAHWKQSGVYKPEFEGNIPTVTILESYKSLGTDPYESFSLDHSGFWKLDGRYGDPATNIIEIQHQIFTEDGSLNIQKIVLPKHFDFITGQIVTPQVK